MTSPFVAAGIAVLGMTAMAAILGSFAGQMQFWATAADSMEIQNDRLKENIEITSFDGQLNIKSRWPKETTIKEIRIVDDAGRIILRQPLDVAVPSFGKIALPSPVPTSRP